MAADTGEHLSGFRARASTVLNSTAPARNLMGTIDTEFIFQAGSKQWRLEYGVELRKVIILKNCQECICFSLNTAVSTLDPFKAPK